MKKSFWGLIWSSFTRILGPFSVVLAISTAVVFWLFAPNNSVSLAVAVPVGIVCAVVIATLVDATHASLRASRRILPRILHGTKPRGQIAGAIALCLLEPSELFSQDTVVAFYYIGHQNFEQLIGIGTVVNIQEDGKIQATLNWTLEGHEETVDRLAKNDSEVLTKTRVKPNLPKTFLEMKSASFFDVISAGGH